MSPLRSSWKLPRLASLLALGSIVTSCAKTPAAEADAPGRGGGEPVAFGNSNDPFAGAEGSRSAGTDSTRLDMLGAWAADNIEGERYQVPIEPGDMIFGVSDARFTVVVFNDYQCPYCARFDESLRQLMATYPTDVRVVIKHFPLAMHTRANAAAKAVLAAHAQGRGQAMHELVFDKPGNTDEKGLRKLAGLAQLPDPTRFAADLSNPTFEAQIQRDTGLGAKLGVSSTPSYFINGIPQKGVKTVADLEKLYIEEIARLEGLLETGAVRSEVYPALMAGAMPSRAKAQRPKPSTAARPGRPDPNVHYAIPVDGRPSSGPDDALVTITQFADFECPYCRKVVPTLEQLKKRYGKDLRIVFFQQPLPMHKQALNAAKAAMAAHRQGKFWPMHDRLYALAEQRQLTDGVYESEAKQLGLDVKRFRKDFKDPKLLAAIEADRKVAANFGASGTPAFFINGRPLTGAQPIAAFATLVDEELAAAEAFAKKNKVKRTKLYAAMSATWETQVDKPTIAAHTRQTISLTGLPVRGKANKAPIELVVCADFDCPFCKRGADLADQLLADPRYKNKIGFYFLHFPLPMHADAEIAHRASVAADQQGQFWAMHDMLFSNKDKRTEDELVALAKQLGLDTTRFRKDLNSTATSDKIKADKATCSQLGVSGTPNFFVNGRSMRGAVPLATAAEVIDEELAGGFEAKPK